MDLKPIGIGDCLGQCEHHTTPYNPFFIGLGLGEDTLTLAATFSIVF